VDEILPFPEFEARLRSLLGEKKHLEIINLIEDQGERYPGQRLYLKYWQLGMAARDGNESLAVHYLDTLVEEGLWISQYLLRNSPSLEPLQDSLAYERRVEEMAALQRAEQGQLLPLLTLRQDSDPAPNARSYPLFMGFHAGGGIALSSLKFWQPAARKGWLVAAPQSSQAQWSGSYVWEDRELAIREAQAHMADLQKTYSLDPERIIAAGHGSGGELAAWLAVNKKIPVNGFIAIAPEGPLMAEPDLWFQMVQSNGGRPLRGVILPGSDQQEMMPLFKQLADLLTALKLPTQLKTLPVPGGNYAPACDSSIETAIDFIMS
jgi:hypothetical protein